MQPSIPEPQLSRRQDGSGTAYVLMWAGNLRTAEVLGRPKEDTEVRKV